MAEAIRVLIVEDQPSDADLMVRGLEQADFLPDWRRVHTEDDFVAHLEPPPDVILCDFALPNFNALHALRLLRRRLPQIPTIVVTGILADEQAAWCLKEGAADFVLKDRMARLGPAVRAALDAQRLRAARDKAEEALYQSERLNRALLESLDDAVSIKDVEGRYVLFNSEFMRHIGRPRADIIGKTDLQLLAPDLAQKSLAEDALVLGTGRAIDVEMEQVRSKHRRLFKVRKAPVRHEDGTASGLITISRDVARQKETPEQLRGGARLRSTLDKAVEVMDRVAEALDLETAQHQRRVAQLASAIAKELRVSEDQSIRCQMAALVHDIGKIGLPKEVLRNSGPSDASHLAHHCRMGHDILHAVEQTRPLATVVLQHHERADGTGYPDGLKGAETLLEARIIGIADVVDEVAACLPGAGVTAAAAELRAQRGIRFDPGVVDACLRLIEEGQFRFETDPDPERMGTSSLTSGSDETAC